MKRYLAILAAVALGLCALAAPTPHGAVAAAVDSSGGFAFLHVDSLGRLILNPTLATLTGPTPAGGTAIAVDPNGNYVYLSVDSTGALYTTGGTSTISLSQITQSGATTGDAATWNGSAWVPVALPGGGDALKALPLSQFAATTSAQLAGVVSNETGTGLLVFGTSPTLTTPILGTPTSVTLTNATGLPISTGVSGLGTGIATWLGTPSSANLASALTDETGTGVAVFGTSPTFTTQITSPKVVFTGSVFASSGSGTPEGSVTAAVGSIYLRTNGGSATTLYVKESGSGNTGWTAVGAGGGGAWGSITGTLSSQTDLQAALDLKAPLVSPTFTGTPAAPTAAPGTNTTQLATTSFVIANAGGGNAALFTSTVDATNNAVASDTTLIGSGVGSLTTAANYFSAGQSIVMLVKGTVSTAVTPDNLTVKIKAGSVTVASASGVALTGALSASNWEFYALITCRTTGASGTFKCNALFAATGSALTPLDAKIVDTGNTVDTTGTIAWDVTAVWASTTAGDIITGTNFMMFTPGTNTRGGLNLDQTDETVTTFSSAGTNTVNRPSGSGFHTAYLVAGAGSGTYTRDIGLLHGNAPVQDNQLRTVISFAASANPTVVIHDLTAGGTTLATVTNTTATACLVALDFVYNASGSTWVLTSTTQPASGSGTVTSASVVTANGVSATVATATTTPAFTFTLGAITPSSVASAGAVSGTSFTDSGLTSGRVPIVSTAGLLADDADMTFSIDTLTVTKVQPTTIELGNASDTTLARSAAGVITVEGVVVDTVSATNTLTNKRVTPRVTTITSSATPTINTDNCDAVTITALAAAVTSMTTNLSGTPNNFDPLVIRFKDDGTGRAITWGTSFEDAGGTLPTTTTASKILTVGFVYNSVAAKWDCVSSAVQP